MGSETGGKVGHEPQVIGHFTLIIELPKHMDLFSQYLQPFFKEKLSSKANFSELSSQDGPETSGKLDGADTGGKVGHEPQVMGHVTLIIELSEHLNLLFQ